MRALRERADACNINETKAAAYWNAAEIALTIPAPDEGLPK